MHRTGKYKMINLIFGFFPFIAAILIIRMREDSGPLQLWLSIIPLGFGNAVVLQTMLIALIAHLPQSAMAVGTGFGQLFRGIGQVGGVGVSSAIFQHILDSELRRRIHGPDAAKIIKNIRHSARLISSLPPDIQREARDSYAVALRAVFTVAAASTLLAYLVRLPIPEKSLEYQPRPKVLNESPTDISEEPRSVPASTTESPFETSDEEEDHEPLPALRTQDRRPRRLSTYESSDGGMDLESDTIGGPARR